MQEVNSKNMVDEYPKVNTTLYFTQKCMRWPNESEKIYGGRTNALKSIFSPIEK